MILWNITNVSKRSGTGFGSLASGFLYNEINSLISKACFLSKSKCSNIFSKWLFLDFDMDFNLKRSLKNVLYSMIPFSWISYILKILWISFTGKEPSLSFKTFWITVINSSKSIPFELSKSTFLKFRKSSIMPVAPCCNRISLNFSRESKNSFVSALLSYSPSSSSYFLCLLSLSCGFWGLKVLLI